MSEKPLSEVEAEHIRSLVEKLNGNMSEAAHQLGIDRRTLYRRCRAMGFYPTRVAVPPGDAPNGLGRSHYRVVCISLYTEDLALLDDMVSALKARGLTKANRSALIRHALSLVDVNAVPKGL